VGAILFSSQQYRQEIAETTMKNISNNNAEGTTLATTTPKVLQLPQE